MDEGWGLTHDSEYLYATDGTDKLFKINPVDFSIVSSVQVTDQHGKAIKYINELELVGDYVYANVLPLNIIIKIDKNTGIVSKTWDMKKLYEKQMAEVKQ